MLTVSPPTLVYASNPAGRAPLEQPFDIRVAPVLADGIAIGAELLKKYGYFVYRQAAAGAGLEIWDDTTKQWRPEDAAFLTEPAPPPAPLAHEPDQPEPWHGIVVAAGSTDALGQPQYAPAVGGYPNYSVRAMFIANEPSEVAVSGPSLPLTFALSSDANLMVIGPGDDEKPETATQARLMLKSQGLDVIGRVLIERDAPGARVTIDNAAGASVVLHPDGHIELRPAAGRGVVVAGDLETERITYLPAGGGLKRVLP